MFSQSSRKNFVLVTKIIRFDCFYCCTPLFDDVNTIISSVQVYCWMLWPSSSSAHFHYYQGESFQWLFQTLHIFSGLLYCYSQLCCWFKHLNSVLTNVEFKGGNGAVTSQSFVSRVKTSLLLFFFSTQSGCMNARASELEAIKSNWCWNKCRSNNSANNEWPLGNF